MPYIPNTSEDQRAMLEAIGVASLDELFQMIPADLQLDRDLKLPPGLGEMELSVHMKRLAEQNTSAEQAICFLGGGSYDHFVPAICDMVSGRSEFYTAYTPYQAEASQGTLVAMFEYQTLVTQLTGMDVSNASLYDGGSTAGEAVLMALSATRRKRVVTSSAVHPEYRQIIATYLANLDADIAIADASSGTTLPERLERLVDDKTACVVIQHPNFFGCLEMVEAISEITHKAGAVLLVAVDPISLGLLKRPGEYGADIVIAEGQPLGNAMTYGGPYVGIMACRENFVRRMPGRLVGQTVDRRGKRCWVLTLQTREQHIRREKATSNICTNQGLMALRATVYLSAMGPEGLRSVADLCLQKSRYAASRLTDGTPFELAFDAPTFKEFVVRGPNGSCKGLTEAAQAEGIFAGVPLRRWYPDLADCLLVAVTEKRTKSEIDRLADIANSLQ